jgi:hypothetical protein
MGVREQIKLALEIEVQKTFDGGVRSDDARVQTGILGKLLIVLPVFVASALRSGDGQRKPRLVAFYSWVQNSISEKFAGQSGEILAIVVVESQIQADAAETDFDAFLGIIAKIHLNGENSGCVGSFFGENRFVAFSGKPRIGADRESVMGVERCGGKRLARRWQLKRPKGERRNCDECDREEKCDRFTARARYPAIINFLHLDAFDSLGLCGVALRPASQTGAWLSVSRL